MTGLNEKNKLKLRQVCFILLAFVPVTKISLLPAIIAGLCEEQLWAATVINVLLDLLVILSIMALLKKHGNTPIFTVVEKSLSKPLARALYLGYGLYFLIKAVLPLLEQQDYIQNVLYEVTPSVVIFLPFFIVSFYTSLKGMKIIGRCADVACFVTAMGLGLVLFLSVLNGNYKNLLPIVQKPTYRLINGCFSTLPWYSDGVYMLMFIGHFYEEKRQTGKVFFSYLSGGVFTVFIMVTFYAVFGPIAKTQYLAVPEMTIFSVAIANAARFDYVGIFLLLFSQVFAIILPVFLSVKCFERALSLKNSLWPAIIVNGALAIFVTVFDNKLFTVLDFIVKSLWPVFVLFGYLLPPTLLLIPKIPSERRKIEKPTT
ncbi:MAG: GerAB/ArcD/ProY family transporter [Clostridia bacterium]|nr:GerAB/ArcD/ProY family transporter [Clostridia bacterium]